MNLPKESLADSIYVMERQHIPFVIERVNRSWTLDSGLGEERFGSTVISQEAMTFIRQVRSYINKNDIADIIPKRTKEELGLKYMLFDLNRLNKSIKGIKEIDISMAYWITAYRTGIISKELYIKGKTLTKVERLAALGSLAKKIYQRKFNGHRYSKAKLIFDSSETRHIWYFISNEVDQVMQEVADQLGKDFIFYWVDAIFFKDTKENVNKVKGIFHEAGYDSKTMDIEEIKFEKESVKVYTKGKGKGRQYDPEKNMKFREFCYSLDNDTYWSVDSYKKRVRSSFEAEGRLSEFDKLVKK